MTTFHVMLLCNTWHEPHSVSINRLPADCFAVIERAQPRLHHAEASFGVNHGGIAIVTTAGVCLTAVNIGAQPSMFECVAVCVASCLSTCLVIVLKHTGPITATSSLSTQMFCISTYVDPIILAGDVNIHIECTSDPIKVEFNDLLVSYSLAQHVTGAMHYAGKPIYSVCKCGNLKPPSADIIDIDLSVY